MDERIISLCMITSNEDGCKRSLFRIADLIDGALVPYWRNSAVDFFDTDRDVLYFPATESAFPDYTIGLYEWMSYQASDGKWNQNPSRLNDQWLEVIYTHHDETENIVKELRNGWSMAVYEQRHDLLFTCKFRLGTAACVLVSRADIVYQNGRWVLSDTAERLSVYRVQQKMVADCRCRKYPQDQRHYLTKLTPGALEETIRVKTNKEILDSILRINFRRLSPLTRKEKQLLSSSLDKISEESVLQEVSRRLECPEEDAGEMVERYFQSVRDQIMINGGEHLILEHVVENDGDLVKGLRELVEQEWETAHASEIDTAERKIAALNEQIRRSEQHLAETQSQQQESERTMQEAAQLKTDIEQQIKQRLQHIREDKAAVMVEEAFITPAVSMTALQETAPGFAITFRPSEGCHLSAVASAQESIDLFSGALEDSIVTDSGRAAALSLLLLGSAACRQPLLLAGPKATVLADAMACAATGQPCALLRLDEGRAFKAACSAIAQSPAKVICITDALSSTQYYACREMMDAFPDRQFVFTVRHHESLLMEPASLFADMIPVLTGLFVDDHQPMAYFCADSLAMLDVCLPSKNDRKRISSRTKWLDNAAVTPLMRNRLANLLGWLERAEPQPEYQRIAIMSLAVGLMVCLHQDDDVITEMLDEGIIADPVKRTLRCFSGVSAS